MVKSIFYSLNVKIKLDLVWSQFFADESIVLFILKPLCDDGRNQILCDNGWVIIEHHMFQHVFNLRPHWIALRLIDSLSQTNEWRSQVVIVLKEKCLYWTHSRYQNVDSRTHKLSDVKKGRFIKVIWGKGAHNNFRFDACEAKPQNRLLSLKFLGIYCSECWVFVEIKLHFKC